MHSYGNRFRLHRVLSEEVKHGNRVLSALSAQWPTWEPLHHTVFALINKYLSLYHHGAQHGCSLYSCGLGLPVYGSYCGAWPLAVLPACSTFVLVTNHGAQHGSAWLFVLRLRACVCFGDRCFPEFLG